MNTESFYLVCFLLGLVFSVLAFVGGVGHLHIGHFHIGHGAAGHGAGAHGRGGSAFNGFTFTAFLCWFGGVGYLLTRHGSLLAGLVLLIALLAGLSGASAIFFFQAKVLLPHERALLPEDTEMRGVIARVSGPLRPDGLGEIIFSLNGTRRSAAARSETGEAFARDAQVLVTRYSKGIASVTRYREPDDWPHELDAPNKQQERASQS